MVPGAYSSPLLLSLSHSKKSVAALLFSLNLSLNMARNSGTCEEELVLWRLVPLEQLTGC